MQKIRYRYTVSIITGFIQRYPKGSNRIDAFLSPSTGIWIEDTGYYKSMPQRPISPLAVAHFIAEGGYNSEYFTKQY